tara:strand:+ start:1102 stop:1320 length:219 start_codon:yes stop_codon:yes gene_type:complete
MGARPRPITHQGIHYASVGWALGDVLRLHPLANDQQIADLLDVDPARVQYWRARAGIPEYRKRGANPYTERT